MGRVAVKRTWNLVLAAPKFRNRNEKSFVSVNESLLLHYRSHSNTFSCEHITFKERNQPAFVVILVVPIRLSRLTNAEFSPRKLSGVLVLILCLAFASSWLLLTCCTAATADKPLPAVGCNTRAGSSDGAGAHGSTVALATADVVMPPDGAHGSLVGWLTANDGYTDEAGNRS